MDFLHVLDNGEEEVMMKAAGFDGRREAWLFDGYVGGVDDLILTHN